jgi:hypothetical protein
VYYLLEGDIADFYGVVRKSPMPEPITLAAVADLAAQLPPAKQKQLAEIILHRLASGSSPTGPRPRSWREIRGSVPYPLCGEDAQAWVSRSRRAIF